MNLDALSDFALQCLLAFAGTYIGITLAFASHGPGRRR